MKETIKPTYCGLCGSPFYWQKAFEFDDRGPAVIPSCRCWTEESYRKREEMRKQLDRQGRSETRRDVPG